MPDGKYERGCEPGVGGLQPAQSAKFVRHASTVAVRIKVVQAVRLEIGCAWQQSMVHAFLHSQLGAQA